MAVLSEKWAHGCMSKCYEWNYKQTDRCTYIPLLLYSMIKYKYFDDLTLNPIWHLNLGVSSDMNEEK